MTNFNNIIVEVIDSIIREISELSYENLNINAKSSYDCLLLANNIIKNFNNIKKNNENWYTSSNKNFILFFIL